MAQAEEEFLKVLIWFSLTFTLSIFIIIMEKSYTRKKTKIIPQLHLPPLDSKEKQL